MQQSPSITSTTFIPSNVFKSNGLKSLQLSTTPTPTPWSYQPNPQFGTLNQTYPDQIHYNNHYNHTLNKINNNRLDSNPSFIPAHPQSLYTSSQTTPNNPLRNISQKYSVLQQHHNTIHNPPLPQYSTLPSPQSNTQSNPGLQPVHTPADRIKVVVRVRPLQVYEVQNDINNKQTCIHIQPESNKLIIDYRAQNGSVTPKQYQFDAISNHTTQTEFQRQSNIQYYTDQSIGGYSSCIFCYGQTGSGKTYTMTGQSDGLNYVAIQYLFDSIQTNSNKQCSVVRCSYLEIYNEQLRDLLQSHTAHLTMRQDTSVSTQLPSFYVNGSIIVTVHNIEDMNIVLKEGNSNRMKRAHALNNDSSRSHTILSLYIDTYDIDEPTVIKHGKLTLVDLCGSENLKTSGNITHDAVNETKSINKSLFCLNNILSALSRDTLDALKPSYRDSVLTKLLADSLFGNGYVLLCCWCVVVLLWLILTHLI